MTAATPAADTQGAVALTPSEDLLLDLLAARHRLEDTPYHVANRHLRTLRSLQAKGLIWFDSGNVERTQKAALTDAGVAAAISPDYVPPALDPNCRSAYFGPATGGHRIDCTRRSHHRGKHKGQWWARGENGQTVQAPVKWTDEQAWGADNARYAHHLGHAEPVAPPKPARAPKTKKAPNRRPGN